MLRTHKIELRPTPAQLIYFNKCAGCMRFVYNKLVDKVVNEKEKYSRKEFQKYCSTLRKETEWMNDIASRATYEAADNFHKAMSNFFASCSGKRKGRKLKLPAFKRKGTKDSFGFTSNLHFSVTNRTLEIQKLKSPISMREKIRFEGTVKSVTIKREANKWFATFLIETSYVDKQINTTQKPKVGVDLGVSVFATLSTGERIENPRLLKLSSKKLAKRQKQLAKKQKGSNRRNIAKLRVAKLHRRIVNQRTAFQYNVVNKLVTNFSSIVIEDLNVAGMVKNHCLAKAISDVSFASFRSKLTYKCKEHGVELIIADRFFPSSKTDHKTGEINKELKLSDRTIQHKDGTSTDRDLNAAINLLNYKPSPKIKGRSKTDRIEIVRPKKLASEAILLEAVNNMKVNLKTENMDNVTKSQMPVFY